MESQNSKTPEPINKKFGTGDCASEITMHTKNESDRPSGEGLGKWVKYRTRVHVFGFFVNQNFARASSQNHTADILRFSILITLGHVTLKQRRRILHRQTDRQTDIY